MRCPTTHGPHRCKLNVGHPGECENDPGLGKRGQVVALDRDAQRELSKAASRIVFLEAALRLVKTMGCASTSEGAACECCKRFRSFATEALEAK
jgi:hypothetical protein